jgi:CheY-like chemotaxis protein
MSTPETSPPTALIVTGSAAQHDELAGPLRDAGYEALSARSAADALELASEASPALFLVDHSPPAVDGPVLCGALRATKAGGAGYLLLLTGTPAEAHLAAALDAGADDFLLRPFGPAILRARLRSGTRAAEARRLALRDREELERLQGKPDGGGAEKSGANRRRAFRVPVATEAGLRLTAAPAGGRAHPARAVDISFTGLLLETDEKDDPGWPVGAELLVELQTGRLAAKIPALVHRQQGRRYALVFPSVVAGGDIDPPDALRRVVLELERFWIRTRGAPTDR